MPSLKSKDFTELCEKIKINDDLITEKEKTLRRMLLSLDTLKKVTGKDKIEQMNLKKKRKHDWSEAKNEYQIMKEDFRQIGNLFYSMFKHCTILKILACLFLKLLFFTNLSIRKYFLSLSNLG